MYCSASTLSGPPLSVSNTYSPVTLLSQFAQIPQLVAVKAVGAVVAALDAGDVDHPLIQIDL
jgi:hypothetical protein